MGCREVSRAYLYKLDLEQLLKVGCREITRAYLYKLDLQQLLKVGSREVTRAYLYKLDEVTRRYSNATVRPTVTILVNTLGSTSFNGF